MMRPRILSTSVIFTCLGVTHIRGENSLHNNDNDYLDHHYGDGFPHSHDPYDEDLHRDHEEYDHFYHDYENPHYYSNYGAGDPHNYHTHGSLVLDDAESLEEFLAMDLLETAVVAVFPSSNDPREEGDLEQDPQYQVYAEIAGMYSHLFRFAHTSAPSVVSELQLGFARDNGSERTLEVSVFVFPPSLLAKNHPQAGAWVRFPGTSLSPEPLKTFIFMESAPLVGQFDWRASERAAAVDLPLLAVFADVRGELHHTYHNSAAEEEPGEGAAAEAAAAQAEGGGGQREGGAGEEGAGQGWWTFDTLSDVLRPVGVRWRHDVNVLVGDKRTHQYEMHNYGLTLPENAPRTVGLGIKHDERHYKRVVVLPGDEGDASKLASEVEDFIDKYFSGYLNPE